MQSVFAFNPVRCKLRPQSYVQLECCTEKNEHLQMLKHVFFSIEKSHDLLFLIFRFSVLSGLFGGYPALKCI